MSSESKIEVPAAVAEESFVARPSVFRQLLRRPSAVFGMLVITVLVVLFLFGPYIAPYPHNEQNIPRRLEGPSADYLLGTDHLGRDILSRLIVGTRVALGTAVPSVLAALTVGLIIGLIAGYAGGWVDNVILVGIDAIQAFPALLLALALMALLEPSVNNVILVIAIAYTPGYARIVRAQVLSVKEEPYIEVERSFGASHIRISLVHIVPNLLAPLLILLAMDLPAAIATEAGLSFLGLGVRPPAVSWGGILSDGFQKIRTSPWPVIGGALALMITTLGFTLFGEALRDILDPRVSGSRRA
jgi:peptide/nickel transport system permease protein